MTIAELAEIAALSLRVSLVSTTLIAVPAVALGWVFARRPFAGRAVVRALVSLPMVLPPVAVGLVLLALFARGSLLGDVFESWFGGTILLTWWAAVLASAVMSFPLLVLGAEQGFASVPARLEAVASTLGASRSRVFLRVTLPLARRGILYGMVFAFARGLGEFGATTLVAGHIPHQTETLSLAIFARIEAFEDGEAFLLCAVSLSLALAITVAAEVFLRARVRGDRR